MRNLIIPTALLEGNSLSTRVALVLMRGFATTIAAFARGQTPNFTNIATKWVI